MRAVAHDGQLVAHVNRLGFADISAVLRGGFEDLKQTRSDVLFLVIVYPVIGVTMVALFAGWGMLELVFPLVAGFALIGPLAAVGLYESSRRAEKGERVPLLAAYRDAVARAGGRMIKMAALLFALLLAWLLIARGLWVAIMGVPAPETLGGLLSAALFTSEGWLLIVVGHLAGALFAATAMVVSVFSLPMLLDGERSVMVAVTTSIRVCLANWEAMTAWGVIVGVTLAIASAPALAGLIVALPLLGHATWRLYRRAIRR